MSITAAAEALRTGDMTRAEELARAAVAHTDDLQCRLVLAQALAWQGRGRDAEAVLAGIEPDELTETEMLAVALPRAANQFWMLSEPERATAYLRNVRSRVAEPTGRTIGALLATFAMNAGNPRRALEIAADVLTAADAEDMAVAWAASTSTLSAARTGRLSEVTGFADRAVAAEHPGLLRYTIGLGQITERMMAAQLDEAAHVAHRLADATAHQPGRAIADVLRAVVLMAQGDHAGAVTLLSPAAPLLDRTGYSWGPLALMLLATASARSGDPAAAGMLSRARSRHGTKSALFAPELGLARAWQLAAVNDGPGAIAEARQAAGMAERSGQTAVAVLVWLDAAELGDKYAAAAVERLRAQLTKRLRYARRTSTAWVICPTCTRSSRLCARFGSPGP